MTERPAFSRNPYLKQEGTMDSRDIKKYLAGLSVAGLISLGGFTLPGAQAGSSS
jgi:radical SAM modification target selenobiotic family peptide